MNTEGLQPLPIDVLSIQSFVVYGSVGNNVALPALRADGHGVAAIPTVYFSNTPHYPSIHGGPIPLAWFGGYLEDLLARDALGQLKAIVIGYLGSPGQAKLLAEWLVDVRRSRPGLLVVVDPVIGDHDSGVYVDLALVDCYRDALLPLADGLTPNSFELSTLTGLAGDDLAGTTAAARTMLGGHTRWVAVTSAAPATWAVGRMQLAVVDADATSVVEHARVDATPKGTGDLFSAVLVSSLVLGLPPAEAARRASDRVVEALDLTRRRGCAELLLPSWSGPGSSPGRST